MMVRDIVPHSNLAAALLLVVFLGMGRFAPAAERRQAFPATGRVCISGMYPHVAACFCAHWVRVTADKACRATAMFVYE